MREVEAYPGATSEERRIVLDKLKDSITTSTDIPEPLKPHIIDWIGNGDHLLEIKTHKAGPNTHFYGMQLGWKNWVVKNDSLKLVETLSIAAMAITTFIAVPAAAPAVLATSLILSAVAVSERLRTKSTSLEPEQYTVLMTLKACGPISVEDLAEKLSGTHLFGSGVWTKERTLNALHSLQAIHLHDGTIEVFAIQANNELWSSNGF